MRFLFVILFPLTFPVLVLLFRHQFLTRLQEPLAARVQTVLGSGEFTAVRPELNYVDVSLQGQVAEPALRERARALVDAIPGLRCRQEDNHIQVRAVVQGAMRKSQLVLTGWLHHRAALQELTTWIGQYRPGLSIDASGVQISSHVTVNPSPSSESMPPIFSQVHRLIQSPASLEVTRTGDAFRVSGHLPTTSLRQAIVLAVPLGQGSAKIDFSGLRSGPYVQPALFADEDLLPVIIADFLTTPGSQSISASGKEFAIRGLATPSMRDRWMATLDRFPQQVSVVAGFEVLPSIYHFPEYVPQSRLVPGDLDLLRRTLRESTVVFEKDTFTAAPTQVEVLDQAAAAIVAAGPEAHIIVGSTQLSGEGANAPRWRTEAVLTELKTRGVPPACLEPIVLESVSSQDTGPPTVEFLVK